MPEYSWILSQSVLKKVDKRKNVKDAVLSKFFNRRRLQFVYAFMKFLNKGAYYLGGTCNYESQQVCYISYFSSQPPKCTTAEMDPNKKIYKKTCRKFQNFYVSSRIIIGQWDILFSVSITSFEIIWNHFQIFRLQRKEIRVMKHFFYFEFCISILQAFRKIGNTHFELILIFVAMRLLRKLLFYFKKCTKNYWLSWKIVHDKAFVMKMCIDFLHDFCREFKPWLELPVNKIPLKMFSKLGNFIFWSHHFLKKVRKVTHFLWI